MRDVIDLVNSGAPILVIPKVAERQPVWQPAFAVEGFVLTDGETVVRASAHAAPFIANACPQLTMLSLGPELLQWFDRHAHCTPRTYIDNIALAHALGSLTPLPLPDWMQARWTMDEADDETYRRIYRWMAEIRATAQLPEVKPFAVYADQYLKATNLLSLMAARGYHVGDALAVHRSADGLVHPTWTVPAVPGRITTAAPPLHAMRHTHWESMRARPGSRWVRLTWPGHVTEIAKRVVQSLREAMPDLVTMTDRIVPTETTDILLGAHHVSVADEDTVTDNVLEQSVAVLGVAWRDTSRPYLFPVPSPLVDDPTIPLSDGKRALMASAAFTVSQLSAMYDALTLLNHRALIGLSDVIPGMGSLLFQVDDRIPVGAIEQYIISFHAHHLTPTVTLGTHWGSMVPASHPLIDVALQLERPTQMPVQCPVCMGVADSERDLQTHLVEDHGYVAAR